jgi:putative DNA-invertase from lambdoid prophage Rac
MAVFGYLRVSTADQTVDNQRHEIERAGFAVEYWYSDEGVSGKVMAMQRPQFADMVTKIRPGETLVVTKLDRLGRDATDIKATLADLSNRGVSVVILQLGKLDLLSPAGKLMLSVLSAMAELERDLICERTKAGLLRAIKDGKKLGRKSKTTQTQQDAIAVAYQNGEGISDLARKYLISRATVYDVLKRRNVRV